MSRRKAASKRLILPDPLFSSELLAKFINTVMQRGKRSVAEKIVYDALQILVERYKEGDEEAGKGEAEKVKSAHVNNIYQDADARARALAAFEKGLNKLKPTVEVRSRRVGGSTYQVPMEVRAERQMALAMRWLAEYAKQRGERTMVARLAGEILDALQGRGGAMKKREDVLRMAKANQAFAHYRW